jgi:hypothetical protein
VLTQPLLDGVVEVLDGGAVGAEVVDVVVLGDPVEVDLDVLVELDVLGEVGVIRRPG